MVKRFWQPERVPQYDTPGLVSALLMIVFDLDPKYDVKNIHDQKVSTKEVSSNRVLCPKYNSVDTKGGK